MKNNIVKKVRVELNSEFMQQETGCLFNVTGWTSVDHGRNFYYCGWGKHCHNVREAIDWAEFWRK